MRGRAADFFIVHDYFTAYNANSTVATDPGDRDDRGADGYVVFKQTIIRERAYATKPIALTEWNIQATGVEAEYVVCCGDACGADVGLVHPERVW
jgi:hypothetical protein